MATKRGDNAANAFLFFIIGALAIAAIGLSANRIHIWERIGYPSSRVKSDMIYILFCGCWTTLGSFFHCLYPLAAGFFWTFITSWLWMGAAITYYEHIWIHGNYRLYCTNSTCTQLRALFAIAWTEFAMLLIATMVICCTWSTRREPNRGFVDTGYQGMYYVYPNNPPLNNNSGGGGVNVIYNEPAPQVVQTSRQY